ncbi:MAG TPA: GNAT family N-acetyltransferase [Flavisolibacter sp.]|nr:GNAT family N-acetyltransferase [Flavisolibacter sp.]
MNLTIRVATKDDAELIADLSRQTFYDTFHKDNSQEDMEKFLNEQFTRGKLLLEVGQPGMYFFLAYLGSEVAGYLKLRDTGKPDLLRNVRSLEIARLYAAQSMIGKGVGKALMQRSIEEAQVRNCEVVWLGVWEANDRAIAFYKSWGFEKFDEQDFHLGNDVQRDWLMKKVL